MKHLILVVDGVPTPNGGGTSQTLANLLSGWQGDIYYYGASSESQNGFDLRMEVRIIDYAVPKWQSVPNRLGRWLNPLLLRWRLSRLQQNPLATGALPDPAHSIVLASSSLPEKLVVARRLQQAGYTVLPYFMDDWMAGSNLRWRGGNLQQIVQQLLQHAPAWLMISEPLQQTLTNRYHLRPKPCLIIHNPAPEAASTDGVLPGAYLSPGPNTLLYAGSIWPMHADALSAVAAAVHLLHRQGHTAYQLHVYAPHGHWQQRQNQLAGPGVHYKGWLPYAQVQVLLRQAWLLVCTASFEAAYQPFSRSSVQTKLTDYMACGRPVLFAGPADAASGLFVDAYDIGFTMATSEPADIAERLLAIARMPVPYRRKQENALREARTTFSKATVQQQLYDFLAQHGPAPTRHRP